MSDAPERIVIETFIEGNMKAVWHPATDNYLPGVGDVFYIRADLHQQATARVAELEAAIAEAIESAESCGAAKVRGSDFPHEWLEILADAVGRDLSAEGYDMGAVRTECKSDG